jgi:hypothetical protein
MPPRQSALPQRIDENVPLGDVSWRQESLSKNSV